MFTDLGEMPLANAFVNPSSRLPQPYFPLRALVCETCLLVQLADFVVPSQMFAEYAYFSSFSSSWLDHARAFAEASVDSLSLDSSSLVVELASNDGYLLKEFALHGIPVVGIEPAENVARSALANGVPTICSYFGHELGCKMANEGNQADLVVGNNVLAHVPDPLDFLLGVVALLKPDGAVSIEVPHLSALIDRVEFDTIYHEHYSYFSLHALTSLFLRAGLRIHDVEELPTHGGSIRVWASHERSGAASGSTVDDIRRAERDQGLTDMAVYENFHQRVLMRRDEVIQAVAELNQHGPCAGYGAAAKASVLTNFCSLTTDQIGFIMDLSPHKQGRLMPGSRIPIVSPENLGANHVTGLVIFVWNLMDEILDQLRASKWNGQVLNALTLERHTI